MCVFYVFLGKVHPWGNKHVFSYLFAFFLIFWAGGTSWAVAGGTRGGNEPFKEKRMNPAWPELGGSWRVVTGF